MTWIGIVVTFFAAWCLQCLYGLTPSFLSADKPVGAGFGPMMSGQLMLVVMIAGIIGPIICGVLTDKVFRGNTKPVMLIGFVLCCIFIYAIQTPFVYVNVPFLIVALALAGLGIQLVCPLLFVYVAKVYSIQIVGKMTGLWMGIGTFGGAAGLFLGGLTVNMYGNYNVAITLIALAAAAGFIFALFMVRPKH
jgi:MFS family permease